MLGQMKRWKLFNFNGHPVFMEPFFLLLVAFFVFSGLQSPDQFFQNLLWAPILFISILWHEIGHAIAIDRAGYGKSQIVLQALGGVTINQRKVGAPPNHGAIISVMGPIFSFSLVLIFGLAYAFYPGNDLLSHFFKMMAVINTVWGAFNLLPIFPMDGGNIMLHGFRKFTGNDTKSMLNTAYVSLGVLALFVVSSLVLPIISPFFVVILAMLFGFQNWQIIQQLKGGQRIRL
jgi:Zn-dependent protease